MSFQKVVNVTQALAIEGDFASANPRFSVPSTEGGFRAGAGGVLIGRFGWVDVATNTLVLNSGTGLPTGFIGRAGLSGLNFNYFTSVGAATFLIPGGFGVGNFFSGGTFWVVNRGTAAVAVGQKAFTQNAATPTATAGAIQFANTGTVIANWVETKWWAATTGAVNELIKMTSQP